jgi:hypothetical protein
MKNKHKGLHAYESQTSPTQISEENSPKKIKSVKIL